MGRNRVSHTHIEIESLGHDIDQSIEYLKPDLQTGVGPYQLCQCGSRYNSAESEATAYS